MADDRDRERNRGTAGADAPGKRDDSTEGVMAHSQGGRAMHLEGRHKNRRTEAVSWLVAAAIVVLGGGAAAYLYSRGHLAASGAGAVPSTAGIAKTNSEPAQAGVSPVGTKAVTAGGAASYPDVGTSPTVPVKGPVVEGYGWQYQKSLGLYRDVPGWAFAAAEGTPVTAVLGGKVVANWVDPTEGREVVINSKNGDSIIYGDLEGPGPAIGTSVQAGQRFAKVGTPGKLSGVREPHLFFEVTMNGEPQDPSVLLPKAAPTAHSGSASPTAGA